MKQKRCSGDSPRKTVLRLEEREEGCLERRGIRQKLEREAEKLKEGKEGKQKR